MKPSSLLTLTWHCSLPEGKLVVDNLVEVEAEVGNWAAAVEFGSLGDGTAVGMVVLDRPEIAAVLDCSYNCIDRVDKANHMLSQLQGERLRIAFGLFGLLVDQKSGLTAHSFHDKLCEAFL